MEDGPVVPGVDTATRRPPREIGSGSGDVLRRFPEPLPGAGEGLGADVEDSYLPEPLVERRGDQARRAAPHADDAVFRALAVRPMNSREVPGWAWYQLISSGLLVV